MSSIKSPPSYIPAFANLYYCKSDAKMQIILKKCEKAFYDRNWAGVKGLIIILVLPDGVKYTFF
jgi:hypothetical protein